MVWVCAVDHCYDRAIGHDLEYQNLGSIDRRLIDCAIEDHNSNNGWQVVGADKQSVLTICSECYVLMVAKKKKKKKTNDSHKSSLTFSADCTARLNHHLGRAKLHF